MKIITPDDDGDKSQNDNASFVESGEASGRPVSIATSRNRRKRNDDRAAALSLEGVPADRLRQLPDEGMQAMEQAGAAQTATHKAGGSTIAVGAYDPNTSELTLRSRGDSPVYLLLYDESKAVALRLTSPADGTGSKIINAIPVQTGTVVHGISTSFTPDSAEMKLETHVARFKQQHQLSNVSEKQRDTLAWQAIAVAQTQFPVAREMVTLNLNLFIDAAAKQFGLTNPGATLVAMSDGMEAALKIRHAVPEMVQAGGWPMIVAGLAEEDGARLAEGFKALAEANVEKEGSTLTWDNMTALAFPLRKRPVAAEATPTAVPEQTAVAGQTTDKDPPVPVEPPMLETPIAFAIADGNGEQGNVYAKLAVDTFVRTMEQARSLPVMGPASAAVLASKSAPSAGAAPTM